MRKTLETRDHKRWDVSLRMFGVPSPSHKHVVNDFLVEAGRVRKPDEVWICQLGFINLLINLKMGIEL